LKDLETTADKKIASFEADAQVACCAAGGVIIKTLPAV